MKVMIAEDDLLMADMLQDVLVENGYEVCGIARTVEEGVTLGRRCKPDLALLDLRLADGGLGTEIAARLDIPGRPGILYATGNGSQIRLTTANGEAVLDKPYRTEDVVRGLKIVEQIVRTGKASPPFPGGFQVLEAAPKDEPMPAAGSRSRPDGVSRLLSQQAVLLSFAGFAYGESDFDRTLNDAARVCAEMMGVPFCRIWRHRPEANDLLIAAVNGWPSSGMRSSIPLSEARSLQVCTFTTGRPAMCADLTKGNELLAADYAGQGFVSTLMVRILSHEGQPWGLLEVDDTRRHEYEEQDVEVMTDLASILSELVNQSSRLNGALQLKIEGMNSMITGRIHAVVENQRTTAAKNLAREEKNVVTQELQHRVRNNLQLIYGMLSRQLVAATEPSQREGISAISRCVITLGRVYDHLMGTGLGERIDFGSYLASLCSSFAEMEDPQQPKVVLTCQATKVMLDLDTVTALGLIVAELISNSYLHAFPDGKGTISVSLQLNRLRDEGTIVVADDGVGFDQNGDVKQTGLGMVRRLVKQINGSVDHQSGDGSVWTLRFPSPIAGLNNDESAADGTPAAQLLGSDLPVLDQATLGHTAKLLKPGTIVIHLRALAERGEALLRDLRAPGAFAGGSTTLADAAHKIAGNCGMLGFERLAYVARHFENAARIAPAQAAELMHDISAALEATINEIARTTFGAASNVPGAQAGGSAAGAIAQVPSNRGLTGAGDEVGGSRV
jgi:two-component sensor histidine kinase/HPt (histidine-containing phosphotransfer) domain-containing protein/CheY-like chemotaxis protein